MQGETGGVSGIPLPGDAQHRALHEGIACQSQGALPELHLPGAAHGGSAAAQEPALSGPEAISKASSCFSARNICQSHGGLPARVQVAAILAVDPMTWIDENLSAGVVRKSLFFHVSTWLIPLSKVMFY